MVMRIGGLASGMDIDELVKKLMQAERAPLNKLTQKKQTYEWQRDAYRNVNTKLKTFDTYIADNLILKSFNSKTASSSNSSLVSAVATGQASGTVSIESVSQLATAARGVGGQVAHSGTTKLSELFKDGGTLPSSIELQGIDKQGNLVDPVKVELTADMTVDDLMSKINTSNAGVSALFENGKLSITAKNTGQGKDGTSIKLNGDAETVFNKLGLTSSHIKEGQNAKFVVNGIATERTSNGFSINGYNITLNSVFNEGDVYDNALSSVNSAEAKLKETFVSLASKYGITDAANKDIPTLTSEFLTKFSALSETHKTEVNAALEKLKTANEVQLSGTTTGKIFDDLSDAAKSFLKDTAINKDTKFTDDQFPAGLTEADKATLKSLTGTQLGQVKSIQEKMQVLQDIEAEVVLASSKDVNGQSAGDVYAGLSDNVKAVLKNAENGAVFTDASLASTTLSDEEKTFLKSLTGEQTTDIKALQTSLEKKDVAVAAIETARTVDVNKVTAADAFRKLSTDAQKFLKETAFDPSTGFTEDQIVNSGLSNEEKEYLRNTSGSHLTAIKNVGIASDELKVATTAQQALNQDISQVNNALKVHEDAKKNLDSIGAQKPTSKTEQVVTLSSTSNVDDMMKKIKDFVDTYNGLVKDLSTQSKETKYRDYAPLTAEQKEDMSENEIKLWEEKAKSGLLRNDALIRTGLTNMRSLIYQSNPAIEDSKYNSLYSIGITSTKNYNEGGTLEIDEKKLREALEANPDAVEKLFKNSSGKQDDIIQKTDENGVVTSTKADTRGFLEKLRGSLKDFEISIEKKAGRSTMTDHQYTIGKSLVDTEKRISSWQDKLKNIESRYWKQFTAMEQAINKANSQSSMFMQGQ